MLALNVWQAILERTNEDNQWQICQATQLIHVNDALAFLAKANVARSQHLATFQGNVELWAADHQRKMTRVEKELWQARDEIRRIATRIPLPGSPKTRRRLRNPYSCGGSQSGHRAPVPPQHQPRPHHFQPSQRS